MSVESVPATETTPEPPRLESFEAFCRWLVLQEDRYEWEVGEVLAMSGTADPNHGDIATNLLALLHGRLKKPCRVKNNDLMVRIEEADRGYFPDLSVVCEEPTYLHTPQGHIAYTNPTVIFEIPSDTSEVRDRGRKFHAYLLLPSLRHYVIVSRTEMRVDVYSRLGRGNWQFSFVEGPDGEIDLFAAGVKLPLAEVYRDIDFDLAIPPLEEIGSDGEGGDRGGEA